MRPRILALRPGAIGDALLTAPALAALRRHFPDHDLWLASNPAALPVLAAMGLVEQAWPFDGPAVTRLFMPREPALDDPLLPVDVGVAWGNDPDGVLAASLRRRGARDVLIVPSRPMPGEPDHVARYLRRSLTPLGVADEDVVLPSVRTSIDDRHQADELLRRIGLDEAAFGIVQPGSGSPAKNWPGERFAEVIDTLRERDGLSTVLLAGPADDEPIRRIALSLEKPVPVVANARLLTISALLRRARFYLGNDSGLSHLAGLVGAPTLALFGPTDPALWHPLGSCARAIRHQPLADLSAEAVLENLYQILTN